MILTPMIGQKVKLLASSQKVFNRDCFDFIHNFDLFSPVKTQRPIEWTFYNVNPNRKTDKNGIRSALNVCSLKINEQLSVNSKWSSLAFGIVHSVDCISFITFYEIRKCD